MNFLLLFCTLLVIQTGFANSKHTHHKLHDKHPVKFTIAIRQQRVEYLRELLLEISNPNSIFYQDYYTPDDIQEIVTDSVANDCVSEWLSDNDISCVNHGDSFTCSSIVEKVDFLFNTSMHLFTKHDQPNRFYAKSTTGYTVPTEIQDYVRFIEGLNTTPTEKLAKKIKMHHSAHVRIDPGLFARESAIRLYNITYNATHNNASGAVIEFQEGGYILDDFQYYQQLNGVPAVPHLCETHGLNHGADGETTLDIDTMGTIASGLCLGYFEFPVWLYTAFSYLATRPAIPSVMSVSYGWAVDEQCQIAGCNNSQEYVYATDTEIVKIGLRCVTIVVASGDAGSPSRSNEICARDQGPLMHAEYPGSSPYVLSVGGTAVEFGPEHFSGTTPLCRTYGCLNGTVSRSINFADVGWTSGGGFDLYSNRSNQSSWQDSFVTEYLESGVQLPAHEEQWNPAGRGYPDIVANGHNCATYQQGIVWAFDGTSCSCPIVAAMIVLLNDKYNRQFGFINPLLYQAQKYGVFDSVIGTNTSCTEYVCCGHDFGFSTNHVNQTKWNPVTGLGQLNFGRLTEYLDSFLDGY